MFLGIMTLGVLPEVTVNGHTTSYYVDDVPVFEDMLPENAVLSVKYTYVEETNDNPEPDPENNTENPETPDNQSDSSSAVEQLSENISNINTGDLILTFVIVNSILLALCLGLFVFSGRDRRLRINRGGLALCFVFINLLAFLEVITNTSFDANAAGSVYVASESDPTLYDLFSGLSEDENGHPRLAGEWERTFSDPLTSIDGSGYYVYPGTESDEHPVTFYYGDKNDDWSNWVLFANKCWRFVRTTESGGVKLLYSGEATELSTCESTYPETYSRRSRDTVFGVEGVDNSDLDISIDLNDAGLERSYYSYGDELNASLDVTYPSRANRDVYVPSTDDYTPYLFNYKESSCYKNLVNGNFDAVNIDGDKAYCETYDDHEYSSDVADYINGEYYLKSPTDVYAIVPTYIECNNYQSGCSDSNIRTSHNQGNMSPRYYYEGHLDSVLNFTCTTMDGARLLDDGRVNCGSSIEVFDSSSRDYNRINGNLNYMPYGDNDSVQKTAVESWFSKNLLSKQNMLADDGFCAQDYSLFNANIFDGGFMTSGEPDYVLGCSKDARYTVSSSIGNGKLRYPVALLNLEEAELMGGFDDNSASSSDFYTLLLDPYNFDKYNNNIVVNHFVLSVSDNGIVTMWYSNLFDNITPSVAPVVILKNSIKAVDGNGSQVKPFVIEGEPIPTQSIYNNDNIKTIHFDDSEIYDYFVDYYSNKGEEYAFSNSDLFQKITVDTSRTIDVDLSDRGLDNVSFLENFKNIRYLFLSNNNLTELPNIDYSRVGELKIDGNHISDLGPAKEFIEEDYRGKYDNFRQTVELNYSNPEDIITAPIVEQYLKMLKYVEENADSNTYVGDSFLPINLKTSNMKFNDSLKSGYAIDPSEPSYEWIDAYVTFK